MLYVIGLSGRCLVGPWMLYMIRMGSMDAIIWSGHHHGWPMDALRDRMASAWTCVDDNMVGPWMLHVIGWGLSGRYHNWPLVGPWMLYVIGWGLSGHYHDWPMDALHDRLVSEWTLSWLAHGCST